ncbi:MAG: ATPase component of an transporter with duplicated ATPase domain [Bacillales bacterium]|jgi:ATP-binding cassette subfamily F protein 3|nr:ATPase component of an transporter with duplicated ATPase domain [Bacillales bacterium]
MILLQVNKIAKYFGATCVLDNVSLEVQTRERIALVGKNGAGKTTLLKIIAGENSYDSGEIFKPKDVRLGYLAQSTSINTQNTIWNEMLSVFSEVIKLEQEMRRIEELLATDFTDHERYLSEYDLLQEKFKNLGGFQYEADIRSVLHGLKFFEDDFNKSISKLSGGQKTRLSLGKLLLSKPDLLILDEPTNHLDIETLGWLEKYLINYNGSVLLVSHDRYFLDKVSTKIYELRNGEIDLYHGNYSYYLEERQSRYAKLMSLYVKQQKEVAALQDFIQRNIARATTTKRAQSRRKKLEKIEIMDRPTGDLKKASFSFDIDKQSGNEVLKIRDLDLAVTDDLILAKNLNIYLHKGDSVSLIGPNGIGKSTLLKKIVSSKTDDDKQKIILGSNVTIGYYDQEQSNLTSNKQVLNELWDEYPNLPETQIRTVLGNFLFSGDDVFKIVSQLSGGEKARLALAKLMLLKANLLILDEPTNHLDLDSKEVLEYALVDYPGTILFVSHDRYFINKLASKVFEFNETGIIEYLGDYDYYLDKLEERKELANSIIKEEVKSVKTSYAEAKEIQKIERQRQRRLEEVESKISEFEELIKFYETELYKPEVYEDYIKSGEYQQEITKNKEALNQLYNEWESLSS